MSRKVRWLGGCLLAAVLAGCGVKASPRPPEPEPARPSSPAPEKRP